MTDPIPRPEGPVILVLELIVALLLAVYLLHKYSNIRHQNPFVTVSTLIVWFLSFVIIFLLPVDVSSAFYRLCLDLGRSHGNNTIVDTNCSDFICSYSSPENVSTEVNCSNTSCYLPYSFICPFPLDILWYIIYWLFFVLSWIVLPLGQSYVLAGYFSVGKRILRALVENALFYVTLFIIFLVLFIYLVVVESVFQVTDLPSLLATASNTWGLLILTLLLGYGLVEVPRSLLNQSRRTYTLNHCYFRAAKLYVDMAEADEKLQDVTERVKRLTQNVKYNDPLRKYVDIIVKKFPPEIRSQFSKGHDDFEDFVASQDILTKGSLESLYKKVTKAVRLSHSTKVHWIELTDQSLDLEDIEINKRSVSRRFTSSVRASGSEDSFLPVIEWYWKVLMRDWVYRVSALTLIVLSVAIIWSEVTFSIQPGGNNAIHLPIFAALIYVSHSLGSYFSIEIISVVIVAYLSICAYFTVFNLRIFNLYYLAPRHATDEYSLLFSAVILSRLALPICLNYLYMIQVVRVDESEDLDVPQTSFAYATGNTGLIHWLTGYFNLYYPALIVLVCGATLFSLGRRLASFLGYQKFLGEDDFSADFIDEGRVLMKRERRLREKNLRGERNSTSSDIRSQTVKDILKERENRVRRQNSDPLRSWMDDDNDDDLSITRLWTKAKGFASKTNSSVSARYVRSSPEGGDDDQVELLTMESRTSHSLTRPSLSKGIFDDI